MHFIFNRFSNLLILIFLFSVFSFLEGNVIFNIILFSVSLLLDSILSIISTEVYFVNSSIFLFLIFLIFNIFRLISGSTDMKERVLFSFLFVLILQNIFFNLFIIVNHDNADGQFMLFTNKSIISFVVILILGLLLDFKQYRRQNLPK
jgi:hypothetical protein